MNKTEAIVISIFQFVFFGLSLMAILGAVNTTSQALRYLYLLCSWMILYVIVYGILKERDLMIEERKCTA